MLRSRKNKNLFLLSLIVLYILVYRICIYQNLLQYAESITTSFSIILMALSIFLLGYRKTITNKLNGKSVKTVISFLIIYFLLIYGLGLSTGYLSNSYSLNLFAIFENTFNVIICIVSVEIFRYIFISTNKDNKMMIYIMTIILAMFEINLFVKYDTFRGLENIFRFIALTLLPQIMNSAMLTYFTYQTNYKASLIYRLVTELYIYIVPIEPDLGEWSMSIFKLVLPFIILMDFSRIVYNYNKSAEHTFSKNTLKKSDIPFIVISVILILLVFGIGPFKMIGIETGSMTPALNVGDAVIIYKNCDVDKLEEKDIIAYKRDDDVTVIHRIIKVNSDGTFITKGDYNNVADTLYVKKDQVEGKVKLRIPFIAYPAKWLR